MKKEVTKKEITDTDRIEWLNKFLFKKELDLDSSWYRENFKNIRNAIDDSIHNFQYEP